MNGMFVYKSKYIPCGNFEKSQTKIRKMFQVSMNYGNAKLFSAREGMVFIMMALCAKLGGGGDHVFSAGATG